MATSFKEWMKMVEIHNPAGYSSQNLFREMAIATPTAQQKLQKALEFIQDIPHVVIGGFAVANYLEGGRSLTPDIDFVVQNLEKVIAKAKSQNLQTAPLLSVGNDYDGIQIPELDADFLVEKNNQFNHYIFQNSVNQQVAGVTVRMVDPNLLTIMKFIIGRDKDLNDAFKLLQSPFTNSKKLMEHIKNLVKLGVMNREDARDIQGYVKAIR